jgi:hypothetical protein
MEAILLLNIKYCVFGGVDVDARTIGAKHRPGLDGNLAQNVHAVAGDEDKMSRMDMVRGW